MSGFFYAYQTVFLLLYSLFKRLTILEVYIVMRILIIIKISLVSAFANFLIAQVDYDNLYRTDNSSSIYLPLGEISFADSVVDYQIGKPAPYKRYSDSKQCLNAPNYISYSQPTYLSLGCGGSLTVFFKDNGFMNLPGYDLYIFEVGPSKEAARIDISENGIDWVFAGNISGGKSSIELNDQNVNPEKVFYYLRITDLNDVCKSKTAGADIDAIGAINSVLKLTISADVLFDVDDFILKETANQILETLSEKIMQVKKATILVEGHTDDDGENDYNKKLSENRCKSVIEKLKPLFGAEFQYDFEIKPYGENKPKVLNDSPENKQRNRRVEITILPPKDYYESILKID